MRSSVASPMLALGLALVFLAGALAAVPEGTANSPAFVSVNATLVGPDGKVVPFDGTFVVTPVGGHQEIASGQTPVQGGAFTIAMPPGKYVLSIPGLREKGYSLKSPAAFEIKANAPGVALTFPVEKLVPLDVLVQDAATRKPLQNVMMGLSVGETLSKVRTDEAGKVRVWVSPGVVKLNASAVSGHSGAPERELTVGPDGVAVTLDLPPFLVMRADVQAASGKPVRGIQGVLWFKKGNDRPNRVNGRNEKESRSLVFTAEKGSYVAVVRAEGLAPVVEPVFLDRDMERTLTLQEGVEVVLKIDMDPAVLPKEPSGEASPAPYVGVLDQNTGVLVFEFSTAALLERGKDRVPVAEMKTRLMPGKYKIICARKDRFFIVEELDLKGPRTVSVEVKKTTEFGFDVADLLKDIRFPKGP